MLIDASAFQLTTTAIVQLRILRVSLFVSGLISPFRTSDGLYAVGQPARGPAEGWETPRKEDGGELFNQLLAARLDFSPKRNRPIFRGKQHDSSSSLRLFHKHFCAGRPASGGP